MAAKANYWTKKDKARCLRFSRGRVSTVTVQMLRGGVKGAPTLEVRYLPRVAGAIVRPSGAPRYGYVAAYQALDAARDFRAMCRRALEKPDAFDAAIMRDAANRKLAKRVKKSEADFRAGRFTEMPTKWKGRS